MDPHGPLASAATAAAGIPALVAYILASAAREPSVRRNAAPHKVMWGAAFCVSG